MGWDIGLDIVFYIKIKRMTVGRLLEKLDMEDDSIVYADSVEGLIKFGLDPEEDDRDNPENDPKGDSSDSEDNKNNSKYRNSKSNDYVEYVGIKIGVSFYKGGIERNIPHHLPSLTHIRRVFKVKEKDVGMIAETSIC